MNRSVEPVYALADPALRTDSPQERLNRISAGLMAPIKRLGSSDSVIVLAAAANIVKRLAAAGLGLDLADKIDSDPSVVWLMPAPSKATARMKRVLH